MGGTFSTYWWHDKFTYRRERNIIKQHTVKNGFVSVLDGGEWTSRSGWFTLSILWIGLDVVAKERIEPRSPSGLQLTAITLPKYPRNNMRRDSGRKPGDQSCISEAMGTSILRTFYKTDKVFIKWHAILHSSSHRAYQNNQYRLMQNRS
jgi:hypothetical protein